VNDGIKVGRLFGIVIRIRPGWFVIVGLLTVTLATVVLPAMFPASAVLYWGLALTASLLLFASVLVHELAHSLVARAQGIEVRGITLFLLGGVSTIAEEPKGPWREVVMAGVGPLTSLALGGALLGAAAVLPEPAPLNALLLYLGSINIILAAFNMLPGFPLDGGRVLRAVLWAVLHDHVRATRGAAASGRLFGYAFIISGVLLVLRGAILSGMWMAFVGWMLVQSARSAGRLSVAEERLTGVAAAKLADPPPAWLPPRITLQAAVRDYLLPTQARCLPVAGAYEGEFDGAVCLNDLRAVDPRLWGHDRVSDVMRSREQTVEVGPEHPAIDVLHLLASGQARLVAIVYDGVLLGLVDEQTLAEFVARAGLADEIARRPAPVQLLPGRPARRDRGEGRAA
jgi:Zn-dependent protease